MYRTFYKLTSDEWSDGPLRLASRALAGGTRQTYLSTLKQFIKRSERLATADIALNESKSVFARRKRGRLSAAILLASLRLMEKLELPPPPVVSECLFFFGVFLSMLARAAGP